MLKEIGSMHGFMIVICTDPVLLTAGISARDAVTVISRGSVRLRSSEYTSKIRVEASNSTIYAELDPAKGMLDPSEYVATC